MNSIPINSVRLKSTMSMSSTAAIVNSDIRLTIHRDNEVSETPIIRQVFFLATERRESSQTIKNRLHECGVCQWYVSP